MFAIDGRMWSWRASVGGGVCGWSWAALGTSLGGLGLRLEPLQAVLAALGASVGSLDRSWDSVDDPGPPWCRPKGFKMRSCLRKPIVQNNASSSSGSTIFWGLGGLEERSRNGLAASESDLRRSGVGLGQLSVALGASGGGLGLTSGPLGVILGLCLRSEAVLARKLTMAWVGTRSGKRIWAEKWPRPKRKSDPKVPWGRASASQAEAPGKNLTVDLSWPFQSS